MKKSLLAVLLTTLLISIAIDGRSQESRPVDAWNWIIPLKTKRADVENAFGTSISDDLSHPFQTYETKFGRITVVYATEENERLDNQCRVGKGTVINYSVSPRKLKLSDLFYDLTKFKRDGSAAPRELVYFSGSLGILIDTTIEELQDYTRVERVVMLEYHAPESFVCPKWIRK